MNLPSNKECVTPYAERENARENPRFSRTLGFTIQLDTVLLIRQVYVPRALGRDFARRRWFTRA